MLLVLAALSGQASAQSEKQLTDARMRMVRDDVVDAGIKDKGVIEALRQTPRHLFVSGQQRSKAYLDMALPIGEGQTISPPFIVAYMTAALQPQPTDRVLEIGTGSGYQAAVLSSLVADVYSIEIVAPLGRKAAQTLRRLKYNNVHTKIGDGFQGWPEAAPFDKIIVTCSPEKIPVPLFQQLREGGRIVVPLGERYQQTMFLFKKVNGKLQAEALQPTFFVPMTGRAEKLRVKKDDSGTPQLLNGSFEHVDEDDRLLSWYYVRQAKLGSKDAPQGERFVTFRNETAGRGAQALQAVGLNGRKISEIEVSLWLQATDVRPGQSTRQLPRIEVSFFDERQAPCGAKSAGPWYGTISWTKKHAKIPVPPKAKLAVLAIGMFGAAGELSIDGVTLEVSHER